MRRSPVLSLWCSGSWARVAVVSIVLGLAVALLPDVVAPRPAAAVTAAAGEYVPLTQARIVDSRVAQGLAGPLTAMTTASFQVTGLGGVPSTGVAAVAMTVTYISPTVNAWSTIWAQGSPQPVAGLNVSAGITYANSFITKVGATTGKVAIVLSAGTSQLAVDVQGYYTDASGGTGATFVPLPLTRAYDARTSGGALGAAASRDIQLSGVAGLPADPSLISAVVLNVTAAGATAATSVEVWKQGTTRPTPGTSLSAAAGLDTGSMVQTAVGSTGTVSVYNSAGSVLVIVDVEGYYTGSGSNQFFVPVTPWRILDTRSGLNTGGARRRSHRGARCLCRSEE